MPEAGAGLFVEVGQAGPIPLDAQLNCAPGEVLALVGPSGSGKSTLLRCIAGIYKPAHARIGCGTEIWHDSRTQHFVPTYRRQVGFVFQSYALFPHLTALQNIIEGVAERADGERSARARQLLGMVRLSGLENRKPAALSGGQQQRVALARALARDPKALLLDEPFSAVDKVTRQRLYRELAELRRQFHMPVVLVTHDLEEAAMLADRLCILHRGRTLQSGSPIEVLERPISAEVARLVDLKNIFTAEVLEHRLDRQMTILRWGPYVLEARLQPQFDVGERVTLAVPQTYAILHRRDRPSRGERENPVEGIVTDMIALGETTSFGLRIDGIAEHPLFLTLTSHVARRNNIAEGARVRLSLLAAGIHLMSGSPPTSGDGTIDTGAL